MGFWNWVLPFPFVIYAHLCCRMEEIWVCRQPGDTSYGRNSTCLPEVLHNMGWTEASSSHLGQFWQIQSHTTSLGHPEIKQMGIIAPKFSGNIKGKSRCKTCHLELSWVSGWHWNLWVACPHVWTKIHIEELFLAKHKWGISAHSQLSLFHNL